MSIRSSNTLSSLTALSHVSPVTSPFQDQLLMAFFVVSSTDIGVFETLCKQRMGSCIWFSVGDSIHLFFLVRHHIADIHYITCTGLPFLPCSYPLSWVIIHCQAELHVLQFLSHMKAKSPPSLSQAVFLNSLYCPCAGMGVSGQEGRAELCSAPQESCMLAVSEGMTPLGKTGERCRADPASQVSLSNPFSLRLDA